MPWLKEHNPIISWTSRKLIGWGELDHGLDKKNCVRGTDFARTVKIACTSISTKLEASHVQAEVDLPPEYRDFSVVFSEEEIPLPPHRGFLDHEIRLKPSFQPKKGAIYPLSLDELKALDEFIDENLKCGKIRPSKSSQAAPVFFVGKKDSKRRLIQDYRYLNSHTIVDLYPLPDVKTLLDELAGSRYFAKFDVRWGFTNIRVKEGDEWKGAFITPRGLFEPTVMFFGQCNSPPTFQRYMDHTFEELKNERKAVIFMDDVTIHSKTREGLREAVRRFLQIASKEHLRLKLKKCTFEAEEIEFLGFVIRQGQYEPSEIKIEAIKTWPALTTLKELRSFLGFCNFYRQFISSFSQTARPLHDLSKKNAKWTWGPEQSSAFEALKKALSSKPVLRLPDLRKPFVLHTDASKLGTGAVLSQADDSGMLHPCAYMSQSLTGAEQNYQVYDLEMLAVMRALKQWRPYLLSPPEPTMVYTDHQNITYYAQPQKLTARQARWQATLQEYPLQFVHIAGTKNSAADTLSRRSDFNAEPETVSTLLPKAVWLEGGVRPSVVSLFKIDRTAPEPSKAPPPLRKVKKASVSLSAPETTQGSDGVRRKGRRIFVPEPVRQDVLRQYHDIPVFGHPGVKAMTRKMNKYVWWPGMYQSIRNYCKGCPSCQANKVNTHPTTPPITPHDVAKNPFPFKQISMDLVTDLPLSGGKYDSIL
ncbi:hypothetical protein M404DRAFT_156113, partial [Pisolithus tinctorius Marx 270]